MVSRPSWYPQPYIYCTIFPTTRRKEKELNFMFGFHCMPLKRPLKSFLVKKKRHCIKISQKMPLQGDTESSTAKVLPSNCSRQWLGSASDTLIVPNRHRKMKWGASNKVIVSVLAWNLLRRRFGRSIAALHQVLRIKAKVNNPYKMCDCTVKSIMKTNNSQTAWWCNEEVNVKLKV